jgi:hypothetical protein
MFTWVSTEVIGMVCKNGTDFGRAGGSSTCWRTNSNSSASVATEGGTSLTKTTGHSPGNGAGEHSSVFRMVR